RLHGRDSRRQFSGGCSVIAHRHACVLIACTCLSLPAQEPATRPTLEQRMQDMQERYEKRIQILEDEVKQLKAKAESAPNEDAAAALDKALAELPLPTAQSRPALTMQATGGGTVKLIDISLDLLFVAGWSTEADASLQTLQGGGHDPHKRGFTVQNAELNI